MDKVEILILRNLLYNEEYLRKVVPFIKPITLKIRIKRLYLMRFLRVVTQYNEQPTKEVLSIDIQKRSDITDSNFFPSNSTGWFSGGCPTDQQWLTDTTEKWCRDRAIYLALMESIALADGQG
jgi:hypothetical protein